MKPKNARRAKSSKLWLVVTGLMCLIAIFPGYGLATLIWLAPIFVLHALRPKRGEPAILAALFFVGSTLMHPARALLHTGGVWADGLPIILNMRTIAAAYAAGLAAWLIAEATTAAAQWNASRQRDASILHLQEQAKALREEWQIQQGGEGQAKLS